MYMDIARHQSMLPVQLQHAPGITGLCTSAVKADLLVDLHHAKANLPATNFAADEAHTFAFFHRCMARSIRNYY